MIQSYEQQGNIIFHGDTINVLSKNIASETVDLIIIDPPYNIGIKVIEEIVVQSRDEFNMEAAWDDKT